jgi:hypothetical protein
MLIWILHEHCSIDRILILYQLETTMKSLLLPSLHLFPFVVAGQGYKLIDFTELTLDEKDSSKYLRESRTIYLTT